MRHAVMGCLIFLVLTCPAQAKWHEASSEHFVVYADDSANNVQRFSEMLETYHAAMELITGRTIEQPSPSNRVTIYAVGSARDIRQLYGEGGRYVGGFYQPRAGRSVAFVQDVRMASKEPTESMIVLLHEYAHHFLISSSRFAMPRWMSEGAAEFFASAAFTHDGRFEIGRPALHRAYELFNLRDVTLNDLLDPAQYEERGNRGYDSYYGKSWLLYHYLMFSPARDGQLSAYWNSVVRGMSSIDAATEAFGDLDQLDKDLDHYLQQRRIQTFSFPPGRFAIGPVTVRQLGDGEAAMMPVTIRSQRGVNAEQAAEVLIDALAIAAQFPDDPYV